MTQISNLKKMIVFTVAIIIICALFAGAAIWNAHNKAVLAVNEEPIIALQIGNLQMTVDGTMQPIDNEGTVPADVATTLRTISAVSESEAVSTGVYDIGNFFRGTDGNLTLTRVHPARECSSQTLYRRGGRALLRIRRSKEAGG